MLILKRKRGDKLEITEPSTVTILDVRGNVVELGVERVEEGDVRAGPLAGGDRVKILQDGDGAANSLGTIHTVYRSGRCRVDLDGGGFRNLSPANLERVK